MSTMLPGFGLYAMPGQTLDESADALDQMQLLGLWYRTRDLEWEPFYAWREWALLHRNKRIEYPSDHPASFLQRHVQKAWEASKSHAKREKTVRRGG